MMGMRRYSQGRARALQAAMLAVAFVAEGAPSVYATTSSSCVPGGETVTSEQATQFLQSPQDLLAKFKDGQGGLSSAIRDLVTSRPETAEALGSLSSNSTPDQSRALGAGLGTAASVCVLSQPITAQRIQELVLKTENRELIQSFMTITGDIPTEAINGAPASGDDSAGGGRGSSQNPVAGSGGANQTLPFNQAVASSRVFSPAVADSVSLLNSVSPSN